MGIWIGIFGLAALDQWSKTLVAARLSYGDSVEVIPGFFNLVYVHNTGAAWSLFEDQTAFLTLISLVALVFLVLGKRAYIGSSVWLRVSYVFLVGGVLGNFIDRVKFRYVIDFIDLYRGSYHWPAFNVADSGICIGVAMVVLHSLWTGRKADPVGVSEAE